MMTEPQATLGELGVHLFVMAHGFQGTHNDMRNLRNQFAEAYPDSVILLSSANESNTDGDIMEMGERLA
jgi:esterase/lipase